MNKTKKMIKIIFLIFIAIIILALAIMVYMRNNREDYVIDGPGMINTREGDVNSVSYYSGGGMEGGYESYSLTLQPENMKVLFEYEMQKYNGSDVISGSKLLEWSAFETIWSLCRETTCLLGVIEGKPSELELLDAPTSTVTFILNDESERVFRSNYDYPEYCNGIISAVYSHMTQFLPQE